jgi:hypothetical protein
MVEAEEVEDMTVVEDMTAAEDMMVVEDMTGVEVIKNDTKKDKSEAA